MMFTQIVVCSKKNSKNLKTLKIKIIMMTYNEANRISIKDYLQSLNILPAKDRNYYGMYHSPFREDHDASMKVDYNKNLWIDYGDGEGGTMIDLVMRMGNCNFQEAIARLERTYNRSNLGIYEQPNIRTDSFPSQRSKQLYADLTKTEPAISIQKVILLTNPALLAYLRERCIPEDIAKEHCMEVDYKVNDRLYYAIGFSNDSGGYELRSKYFKGCTAKDISSKTDTSKQDNCHLFEGFMDYLSFLTMEQGKQVLGDVIVLNSLTNLSKVKNTLVGYRNVTAFLDNDEAGHKAVCELKSICRQVNDLSSVYSGFKDLNDYLCGKKQALENPVKKRNRGLKL